MPDSNLAAALRGSLAIMEDETEADSPLREATPDAVDFLLDQINSHLIEGVPQKITDDLLSKLVDVYRAQAYRWEQEEQIKRDKPRKTRGEGGNGTPKERTKSLGEVVDVDLLSSI